MTEEQRILRERFLEPETRDGVLVPVELKRAWKVMLDMFEEFVRICDKYGLKYCLDGGSCLGAIRHKGFIPWDDDFDVSLPRADFDKFLSVAQKELKLPYVLQDAVSEPEHYQAFACIKNVDTTGIYGYWVKCHKVHGMGIGIDIFPIDAVPDDEALFRRMIRKERGFRSFFARVQAHRKSWLKEHLVRPFYQVVCHLIGLKRLVRWRNANLACCQNVQNRRCGSIAYNLDNKRAIWESAVFADRVLVPFEYLDVYVPVGYEVYLLTLYGENWRTPIRGGGDHDALDIDVDVPYKRTLIEKYGYSAKELERLPGGL